MNIAKLIYYFQRNQTPIEIAFYGGHEDIVKLLLANNCDIGFYNVIIIDNIDITAPISGDNSQRNFSICLSHFNGNRIGETKSYKSFIFVLF